MYSLKIMQMFYNPKNVGLVKSPSASGEIKNLETSEIIKFTAKIEDETIKEIKFKAFGNALLIALASLTTELVKGKNINELENLTAEDVLEQADEIPYAKTYCADMIEQGLKALKINYDFKQEKLQKKVGKE